MNLSEITANQVLGVYANGELVDRVAVRSVETHRQKPELRLESLDKNKGQLLKFFLYDADCDLWKLLFLGLFDEQCFSERAPVYTLELVSQ